MLLFFGENVLIGAEGVPWEGRTGYEMWTWVIFAMPLIRAKLLR